MKAIIPVAGIGSRLRPHTHTQPKALIPVAGNTILGHIIKRLLAAGIEDFVFIIGYLGEKIEAFVKREYPNIRAEFVVQEPREGLGHALYVARETYENETDIIIILGDTVVDVDMQKLLEHPGTMLGVKKVDTPSLFGVTELGPDELVTKVVEKPKIPKSNIALVGLYKIHNPAKLVAALAYMMQEEIKTLGEYHLSDALMHLIKNGEKIATLPVDNWFDCGRKETLLQANAILLNRPPYLNADNLQFPNTIIIPPVSIGQNCTIANSIIGPNVAIGDYTIVQHTILHDSIIGSYSELRNAVMHDSIVGNDASLLGLTHSFNIGDNTEINFSE
ncbi:sugar phosphate nucleotidyltransferase [Adhaeribacter rhizoryzae]|uniref:NTP transferase domain-containing protein n=1 Tax=Adhaeribacter rhizoryzae TaxID=2607907 RepID=A0A5M6D9L0_9BACT|nr:sugar phosphate nucleotidyltransferase [Adhaeribacter rhizoryzae]KAA5544237.1 NTP transferase domain-containing protein [Adhaeribacter rhizoryzae]